MISQHTSRARVPTSTAAACASVRAQTFAQLLKPAESWLLSGALYPPVKAFQCSRGHAFCADCLQSHLRRVPSCPTCSVPIKPQAPARYLVPQSSDSPRVATRRPTPEADDGKQALSETMRGGWDWLVESSDDEEGEQQLRRALATVEAEAKTPAPKVTKQYLGVRSRRASPKATPRADESSPLSVVSGSASFGSAGGAGNRGSTAAAQRAKRRWERSDSQLQGYFSSLLHDDRLASPTMRVRSNISSMEKKYEERVCRRAESGAKAVQSAKQAAAVRQSLLIAGLHTRLQISLSARAWCAGRRRRGRHYLPARGADAGVPKHHAESAADPRGGASGGSDGSEPAAGPAQPAEARGRKAARRGHASAAARSAEARGGPEPSALQAAGGEAAGRDGAARHPLSHGDSSWGKLRQRCYERDWLHFYSTINLSQQCGEVLGEIGHSAPSRKYCPSRCRRMRRSLGRRRKFAGHQ